MVRMDECVEAIYDKDTTENKQKTLRMIRVLKGAISVSKSKTGECIFRNNKLEARNLERTIKSFRRDSLYVKEKVDTHKRAVMNRWRRMLEKQTAVNSQSMFEEILDIKQPKQETSSCKDETEDNDTVLKKFLDLRLQRTHTGEVFSNVKRTETTDEKIPRKLAKKTDENADEVYVTERKEIRRQYSKSPFGGTGTAPSASEHKVQGSVLCTSKPVRLPSVKNAGMRARRTSLPMSREGHAKKGHVSGNMGLFDRDLTDWQDWRLKDKDWILEYIRRQRTRHEDLLIRNALNSIETDMSGPNLIRRQQVLGRLRNDSTVETNTKSSRPYQTPRATSGPVKRRDVKNSSDKLSDAGSVKSSSTFPRTRRRQNKVRQSWPARDRKLGRTIHSGAMSSATILENTRKLVADDIRVLTTRTTPRAVGVQTERRPSLLSAVSGGLSVIPEIQIIPPTTVT